MVDQKHSSRDRDFGQATFDAITESQYLVEGLRGFRQQVGIVRGDLDYAVENRMLRQMLETIYSRQDRLDYLLIECGQVDHLAELYPDNGVEYCGSRYRCYSEAAMVAANSICLMLHIAHPDTTVGQRPSVARRGTGLPFPLMDVTRAIRNHWDGMVADPCTEHEPLDTLKILLFAEYRKTQKAIFEPPLAKVPEQPAKEKQPIDRKERQLKWMAEALLLVQNSPTMTDADIAKAVGIAPGTLSRNETFRRAAAFHRGNASGTKKGFITRNTATGQSDVDAYVFDDQDDDSDD